MQSSKKISRNKFLKILGTLLLVPSIYSWIRSVKRHKIISSGPGELIVPMDLPKGISFIEDVIIHNNAKGIKVFSSKCTHLGCKIDNFENNLLICPCHGSVYNTDGSVNKGPSKKPLTILEHSIDAEKGNLIIKLT